MRVRRFLAAFGAVALVLFWAVPARAETVRGSQWYLKTLNVAEAQKVTKGEGIVVAVLDSGVSSKQSELQGATVAGFDVALGAVDTGEDIRGHGTSMAVLIAGRGRGDGQVLGIAPESKIMAIREGGVSSFAEGISYAQSNGAKVINISQASSTDAEGLQDAIQDAVDADVVVVAGSGNTGNKGNPRLYPAAHPQVLTVGALDKKGRVPAWSQYGNHIDLVAPGTDLPYTVGGVEELSDGTSGAAAIVSGAVALVRAEYPALTATQVIDLMTSTATDAGPKGRDDRYGHGKLNLMAALTKAQTPTAPSAPPTASAAAPAPPNAAAPTPAPRSADSTLLPIALIVGGVLVAAGAVATLFLVRRRLR